VRILFGVAKNLVNAASELRIAVTRAPRSPITEGELNPR
jgi:hypothetical protein